MMDFLERVNNKFGNLGVILAIIALAWLGDQRLKDLESDIEGLEQDIERVEDSVDELRGEFNQSRSEVNSRLGQVEGQLAILVRYDE